MNNDQNMFADPLDQAFEVSEVIQCGSKVGNITAQIENLLPEPKRTELEEADRELMELASKQIKTSQFKGALQILNKLRKRRGINAAVYQKASEAKIGMKDYLEAEIYALMAYQNGEKTIANLLNLASLAAMRKDQLMAGRWLKEAKKIDADNELYKQCKELLFPNGESRDEDKPFIRN